MHTGQKYALNLGQRILTSGKSALNLGHVYAHRAELCPESEARFYPLCISMNWIQGKVLPPGDGLPEISGIIIRVRNGSDSPKSIVLFNFFCNFVRNRRISLYKGSLED